MKQTTQEQIKSSRFSKTDIPLHLAASPPSPSDVSPIDSPSLNEEKQQAAFDFYKDILRLLIDGNMPFLLGGTQAYERYTGVRRDTKDLDIFARREDLDLITHFLEKKGYKTEMTFPHWLAKVYQGDNFIDIIFSSANGTCPVTSGWFQHAHPSTVYGLPVKLIPVEEMIFSKAYIMEKERYDGGDVNHLIRCHGPHMDWKRVIKHFDNHWRVLFSHVVMFGFVYPDERSTCVPDWVIEELSERLRTEQKETPSRSSNSSPSATDASPSVETQANQSTTTCERTVGDSCVVAQAASLVTGIGSNGESKICNGPLVSRAQYLTDVYKWGYTDGRLQGMTHDDIYEWTRAMPDLVKYTQKLMICRHSTSETKETNNNHMRKKKKSIHIEEELKEIRSTTVENRIGSSS